MKNNKEIRRGEIYFLDFGEKVGTVQTGIKPVIVLQSDFVNRRSSTTVVAVISETTIKKKYLPVHILITEDCGLEKPSMIMLEQVRTVGQSELKDYVGCVSKEFLRNKVNPGIYKISGQYEDNHRKHNDEKENRDVRCLCGKCLADYRNNPNYIVRRNYKGPDYKERCDKCDRFGWEYIISERKIDKE